MKDTNPPRRQVPIWAPATVFLLILLGLVILFFPNPFALELLPAFPVGLGLFAVDWVPSSHYALRKALAITLIALSYVCFLLFFFALPLVRTWKAFGILLFLFVCLVLLNLAGCHMMGAALSN